MATDAQPPESAPGTQQVPPPPEPEPEPENAMSSKPLGVVNSTPEAEPRE